MKDQRVDGGLPPERFAAVAREQRVEPSRDRAMRISRSRSVTGKVTEEEYAMGLRVAGMRLFAHASTRGAHFHHVRCLLHLRWMLG